MAQIIFWNVLLFDGFSFCFSTKHNWWTPEHSILTALAVRSSGLNETKFYVRIRWPSVDLGSFFGCEELLLHTHCWYKNWLWWTARWTRPPLSRLSHLNRICPGDGKLPGTIYSRCHKTKTSLPLVSVMDKKITAGIFSSTILFRTYDAALMWVIIVISYQLWMRLLPSDWEATCSGGDNAAAWRGAALPPLLIASNRWIQNRAEDASKRDAPSLKVFNFANLHGMCVSVILTLQQCCSKLEIGGWGDLQVGGLSRVRNIPQLTSFDLGTYGNGPSDAHWNRNAESGNNCCCQLRVVRTPRGSTIVVRPCTLVIVSLFAIQLILLRTS